MVKAKYELRSRTANVAGKRKNMVNFDLSSCLGEDVTQNVSSAHEMQLSLA